MSNLNPKSRLTCQKCGQRPMYGRWLTCRQCLTPIWVRGAKRAAYVKQKQKKAISFVVR